MDDHNLILAIQKHPSVYDSNHESYANKDVSARVWANISECTGQPAIWCQKRWRCLRDYYVRHLRMLRDDHPSRKVKKQWPLFPLFNFLNPYLKITKYLMERDNSHTRRNSSISSTSYDITNCSEDDASDSIEHIGFDEFADDTMKADDVYIIDNSTDKEIQSIKVEEEVEVLIPYDVEPAETSSRSRKRLRLEASIAPTRDESLAIQSKELEMTNATPSYSQMDEHEHFFKSMLSSVRKINDDHILQFRIDVAELIVKYQKLDK